MIIWPICVIAVAHMGLCGVSMLDLGDVLICFGVQEMLHAGALPSWALNNVLRQHATLPVPNGWNTLVGRPYCHGPVTLWIETDSLAGRTTVMLVGP